MPIGDGTESMMPAGSTSSTCAIGSHSSGVSSGTTPVNAAGATPTIVYGSPRSVSDLPTIAGSLPNSRCHMRCEITTTRGAAGSSSDGTSRRPRNGCTPSIEK